MEQNKYEKLFIDWLDLTEFKLVKHDDDFDEFTNEYGRFSLIDLQGANLGNIEGDRFDTAEQIIERMSGCYLDDYILFDLEELFPESEIYISNYSKLTICEWWLRYAEANPKDYETAKLEFDLLDLFVNHYKEINLENCV